nr:uncharacterized protein LOC122269143 [Parasteatoda tepidariorum]
MIKIYRSIIRSKIDYGSIIYGSARKSVLRYLDTVHHEGIRIATGSFRTSPIQSLLALYHEPSLIIRRAKLALNYYFHIKSHPNHPMFPKILTPDYETLFNHRPSCVPTFGLRMKKLLSDFTIEDFDILPVCKPHPPWIGINFPFIDIFKGNTKEHTSSIIYQQIFNYHREQYADFNPVFTDGSKTNGHTASAVVANGSTVSEKLPPSCSVFTSEAHAIFLALQFISSQPLKKWYIYSDSKSCIEALLNCNHKPHSIINCIFNLYNTLKLSGYKIIFSWIPGHTGILGNEVADRAAKSTNNLTNHKSTLSDVKNIIKCTLYSEWQKNWNNETNNKLHSIYSNLQPYTHPNLLRKLEVVLSRLRIGHTRRHLLLNEPAPECSHCKEPLTMKHILTKCSKFKIQRQCQFGCFNPSLILLIGNSPHDNIFSCLKAIGFDTSI